MGLLDVIEKALFEQKSEAQREEELKGIKVFDLPAPEDKFSWKVAFDLLKGKEVPEKPNRYHHQDIMLEKGGNFDLIRVYKRKMSKEEGLKASAEFNKYMQDALLGRTPKQEKEKGFSFRKFIDSLRNASDNEVRMARGKSPEFNKLIEEEEKRRSNLRRAENYKTVEVSVPQDNNSRTQDRNDSSEVAIQQVMKINEDGSVRNLGRMYRKIMSEREAEERKEQGENWRRMDEPVKRTYVRFENEDTERER